MFHVTNNYRIRNGQLGSDDNYGNNGAFAIPRKNGVVLRAIASDGMEWEHVSVSLPNRTPRWDEMCFIKDMFWDEEDAIVQFHPSKDVYVNQHPYCLHLWLSLVYFFPTPDHSLVGSLT